MTFAPWSNVSVPRPNKNSNVWSGLPMLSMFMLGSAGVVAGALLGAWLIGSTGTLGSRLGPLAGMYTGTYIGGSINFNALALHYGVAEQGAVFAGAVVVDNVLSTAWMAVTLVAAAFFLVGRAMDEVINPRLRRR